MILARVPRACSCPKALMEFEAGNRDLPFGMVAQLPANLAGIGHRLPPHEMQT
jgi:hypothetical protein